MTEENQATLIGLLQEISLSLNALAVIEEARTRVAIHEYNKTEQYGSGLTFEEIIREIQPDESGEQTIDKLKKT